MLKIRNEPAPRNRPVVPGDMNWMARQRCGAPCEGIDKEKFDKGYDAINWKSKRKPCDTKSS